MSIFNKVVDFYKTIWINASKTIDIWRAEIYFNKYKGKKYFDDAFNTHPRQNIGFFGRIMKKGVFFAQNSRDYCDCNTCVTLTSEAQSAYKGWRFAALLFTAIPFILFSSVILIIDKLIKG
jgi:hypothetical protein